MLTDERDEEAIVQNKFKRVREWKLLSCVQLFAPLWTTQSMEFSRPEYWSGQFSLLQGIFPSQGSNAGLPHCRRILYQLSHKGNPSSRQDIVKQEHQAHSEQVWGQDWRRGIENGSLNGSLCPDNWSCPLSYSTFCHVIERQLTGKQIGNQRTFLFKNYLNRNSLAVQQLGLRAFTAEGQGTKIPQAMCHGQKTNYLHHLGKVSLPGWEMGLPE